MPTWLNTTLDIVNRLNVYRGDSLSGLPRQVYPAVKIDTMPKPAKANNYLTLNQFGSIEYGSQHLWAVMIAGAPAPFNSWFPAKSVEEQVKGATVSSMSFGVDEISMLNGFNAISMRCEMLDDENATLENWIKAWQKAIATDPITGKPYIGFRYIEEVLTKLTVTKYNWQKERISTTEYYVMPTGNTQLNRNDEPGVQILTVNFAVFGQQQTYLNTVVNNKLGSYLKNVL